MNFETTYQFGGSNQIVEQHFTIPSSMTRGSSNSVISDMDSELNYMKIDIDVTEDGGVFSVIALTDFSDLNVFLSLTDNANKLIAIEKTGMLDEVATNADPGLNNDESSVAEAPGQRDMIHSIELPELSKGKYKLKIGLPRAYWIKQ